MAIKITVSDRVTFTVKGTIADELGAAQGFEFQLTARRLDADQQQAALQDQGKKIDAFMADIVVGWKKVVDDAGAEVPFSPEALAQFFKIPGIAALSFARYLVESGAKEKN